MRDPLIGMIHSDMRQRELSRVLVEHFDDTPNLDVCNAGRAERPIGRGQVMVRHRQMLPGATRAPPLDPQLIEGQERLSFVDQVEIDVKQILALRRYHDHMLGPYLVEQRATHWASPISFRMALFSS